MNKILFAFGKVYVFGYIICVLVTIPAVIYTVYKDKREKGKFRGIKTSKLIRWCVIAGIKMSVNWFFLMWLYAAMLLEMIQEKRCK